MAAEQTKDFQCGLGFVLLPVLMTFTFVLAKEPLCSRDEQHFHSVESGGI